MSERHSVVNGFIFAKISEQSSKIVQLLPIEFGAERLKFPSLEPFGDDHIFISFFTFQNNHFKAVVLNSDFETIFIDELNFEEKKTLNLLYTLDQESKSAQRLEASSEVERQLLARKEFSFISLTLKENFGFFKKLLNRNRMLDEEYRIERDRRGFQQIIHLTDGCTNPDSCQIIQELIFESFMRNFPTLKHGNHFLFRSGQGRDKLLIALNPKNVEHSFKLIINNLVGSLTLSVEVIEDLLGGENCSHVLIQMLDGNQFVYKVDF